MYACYAEVMQFTAIFEFFYYQLRKAHHFSVRHTQEGVHIGGVHIEIHNICFLNDFKVSFNVRNTNGFYTRNSLS